MLPFAKIKGFLKQVVFKTGRFFRRAVLSYSCAAFVAGAFSVLAFPPYHFLPALLGFAVLGYMLNRAETKKAAFMRGFWFGFGHFGVGLAWVGKALLIDPRFAFLAFAPFFGFGLWGTIFTAFPCLIAKVLAPAGVRRLLVFSAAWGFFEWVRSWLFTGFPWNQTASVFSSFPVMLQTASFWGAYGLGIATVFASSLPALIFLFDSKWLFAKKAVVCFGSAAVVFIGLYAFGAWRLNKAFKPDDFVRGVTLRLVQPNVEQTVKWSEQKAHRILDDLVYLSSKKPDAFKVSHVVWSETATQFLLTQDEYARAMAISGLPSSGILLAGTLRSEKIEDENAFPPVRVYNSIAAINDIGSVIGVYDKSHLVPFGEYAPLRSIFPFMGKVTAGQFDFSRGEGAKTVSVPRTPPVGMLVCYEILFPANVVDKSRRPYWLLNVTNDGWYGISAGPYQHFAAAVLRAVEEGLPVVRGANTGISGVIDSYGRVVNSLGLGMRGFLDSGLPRAEKETIYAKHGNAVPLAFALLLTLFSFLPVIIRKKTKEKE